NRKSDRPMRMRANVEGARNARNRIERRRGLRYDAGMKSGWRRWLVLAVAMGGCANSASPITSVSASHADGADYKFLGENGAGSLEEANAYYAMNIPGFLPGKYTFAQWSAGALDPYPQVSAFYKNKNELGFWRQMRCSKIVTRGRGGCVVTNWDFPSDIG